MAKRLGSILVLAFLYQCLPGKAPAEAKEAPDVKTILAWLDDMYRSSSSIALIELAIVKPRRTSTMRLKAWTKGTEKALMLIEAPPKYRGYATLKVERNLWNYMPQIARTIRIPPSMMLGSWMGTDFTNDDLVREASLLDDFDAKLAGRSENPEGLAIALLAKEGSVGLWDRIEYIVSPDGNLPLEARYFDRKGRLSRIMRFDEVREFSGRRIPSHMVLTPMDRDQKPIPDQFTEMRYLELELDTPVPDDTFSLSRLERKR
jgi:hypothetical protein